MPPSTTSRAEALGEPAVPRARGDGDDRARLLLAGNGVQQPLLPPVRLLVHVRDLDAADHAARDPERQRAAGIVGVHVHLERARVADDEQRVADPLQLALETVGVEPVALHHEDGAVAVLRELLVDRLDAELAIVHRRLRQRRAVERRRNAADDLDQAGGARIDDSCLAEHRQHVARPLDRVVPARDDRLQVSPVLRGVRHRGDRGEHRPLDRLLDRAVGGIRRRAEDPRELVGLRERVGGAAHDLREDHARVAAGAHQRGPRHLLREAWPVVRPVARERFGDRPDRQRQVRAGVAVRHRVHVQVVDPRPARLDRGERAAPPARARAPSFPLPAPGNGASALGASVELRLMRSA